MFFTLWLGTPVTLPCLLSRENSSPHPCSGGVKQCSSRWMGLSIRRICSEHQVQNMKNKLWNISTSLTDCKRNFVKSSNAHIFAYCFSIVFGAKCKHVILHSVIASIYFQYILCLPRAVPSVIFWHWKLALSILKETSNFCHYI